MDSRMHAARYSASPLKAKPELGFVLIGDWNNTMSNYYQFF
jgi:hypothetical protein